MPEMRNRRNDKILRAVTRNTSAGRRWIADKIRTRDTENETRRWTRGIGEGSAGFCFEFNGPRRGVNSLEGNPLDPRSVMSAERAVVGVFITLMECERYTPEAPVGLRGWAKKEAASPRRML